MQSSRFRALTPLHLAAVIACAVASCAGSSRVAPAVPSAAAAEDPFAALSRELTAARRAHDAKDWPAMLAHAQRAVAIRGQSVSGLYTLACAGSLAGDAEAARTALHALAKLRVYFDLAADDDFAPIRASAVYAEARAAFEALFQEHAGHSELAFTLRERDLVTEGLAHERRSGALFVSSVHRRKILRIARDGTVSDFVTEGRDGLWAVFAIAIDAARGTLLALSAPIPEMRGYDAHEAGATGVFEYDLATAALRRKVLLPPSPEPRAFNDLVLAPDGTAYIGDGRNGAIVTLAVGADHTEPFLPPGRLLSAQGLAFSHDGRALYVADYVRGLARIELATRAVRYLAAPKDTVLGGIDALVAHGDVLVATQNGIRPHRVLRLTPSARGDRIESMKLLELNDPRVDEPTLGTVVGDDFYYLANSQWASFTADGTMWPVEKLRDPLILKVRIE